MRPEQPGELDPLTPEAVRNGLSPQLQSRRIYYFKSVESTNKTLRQAARQGAPEGTVVLAEEQTAGRGRLNRTWISPPGVGIYMSLLLRPTSVTTPLFLYTFLPAVATARAIRKVTGLPVFIHWPNDLTLRGRKVSGILTDIRSGQGHPREVILGVGINVNHMPADFPSDLHETATSLAMAAGRRYSRAAIVQALLAELERGHALLRQDMPDEIISAWRKLSPSHCGTPVTVMGGPSGTTRGVTRGLDDDGALLVERSDGQIERIAFGEIRRIRGGRGPATRP